MWKENIGRDISNSRWKENSNIKRDPIEIGFRVWKNGSDSATCVMAEVLISVVENLDCFVHVKVKWSRYRPGVAPRVGRGLGLLFHDRGPRSGWVVSSRLRPHFTPGKDPVSILQEAGWAPGPVWRGGKSRPHRYSIPDRPARSQSLYRLSYPAHVLHMYRSV